MRKIFVLMLAITLVLSMTACSGGDKDSVTGGGSNSFQTETDDKSVADKNTLAGEDASKSTSSKALQHRLRQ